MSPQQELFEATTDEAAKPFAWLRVSRCGCVPAIATADFLEESPKDLAEFLTEAHKLRERAIRVTKAEYTDVWQAKFGKCPHDPLWGVDTEADPFYVCQHCHEMVGVRTDRRTRLHYTKVFVESSNDGNGKRWGHYDRVVCVGALKTYAELHPPQISAPSSLSSSSGLVQR